MYERALILTLAFGALSFGAVYPWGYWPLAIAATILGCWAFWRALVRPDERVHAGVPRAIAVALAAVAVALTLQVVPIPRAAFVAVAPAADQFLREYAFGYAFHPPAAHTLSLNATATWPILAMFVAFAILLLGLICEGTDIHLTRIGRWLVVLGLGMAAFGVIQRASLRPEDSHLVYGVWESAYRGEPFGPFVNRNHFAGWMLMTLAVSTGHAIGVLSRSRRPQGATVKQWLAWLSTADASRFAFVVLAIVIMATSLALTGSWSGLAGWIAAAAVLVTTVAHRASSALKRGALVAFAGAFAAFAFLWAALSAALIHVATVPADIRARLNVWRDTWRIIRDFPWAGTGLGNYDIAMLLYQSDGREVMFADAHNDYLQLVAEGGVLVAVPAIVGAIVLFRTIRRRFLASEAGSHEYWLRVGAVAALAGIATQSLVDFSLQMPGNVILCVVVLALALHRPPRRSSPHAHRV